MRHDSSILREDDGAVRFDDFMEEFKAKFDSTSQESVNAWITLLAKGGRPKKRFQCCLNPNSSKYFLCFREIQGHSGGKSRWSFVHCNTMYCCRMTPAECIYHIGKCKCIVLKNQKWIDPRRRKSQRWQAICVFPVHPMVDNQSIERSPKRFGQTKDRTIQKYWRLIKTQCIGAI